MKHNLKTPCSECPFRTTAMKGWLGPDTPQEVMRRVHGESGYPCHMSVTEEAKSLPDDEDVTYDIVEQCAGAVIHANQTAKCYFRDPALAAHQDTVGKTKVLGFEFLKYHTVAINAVSRKRKPKPVSKTRRHRKTKVHRKHS